MMMASSSRDSRVARIMTKVQGAVAKLRPKISPMLEHLNCVQSCLGSQQSCDTNTNNKAKKNSKTNKKTVHELNSGKLTVLLLSDKIRNASGITLRRYQPIKEEPQMARKQSVLTNIISKNNSCFQSDIIGKGKLLQKIQKNSEYLNNSNVSCRSLKAMTESCLWDYLKKINSMC